MVTHAPPPDFETGNVWTDRGWLPHEYVERAAIIEFVGGFSRAEAERLAKKDYQARRRAPGKGA